MKEKIIATCAYGLVLVMIGAIAFIFGLLSRNIEKEVVYKDKLVKSEPIVFATKIKEKIVYRDRIVYRDKVVYKGRVMTPIIIKKGKLKVVYKDTPERVHFGLSLVGGYYDSENHKTAVGWGFKLRYKNYYGQTELLSNHVVLLGVGYEF